MVQYHSINADSTVADGMWNFLSVSTHNNGHHGSQLDELVAAGCQVCDGDSPLLLDILRHRLQLLPADVDELASVVNHP